MKMKLDVTNQNILKLVKDVPNNVLISWCGYDDVYDYESQSERRFNRNKFIDEHYEDILENFEELWKK